jgi:hypothetical protein
MRPFLAVLALGALLAPAAAPLHAQGAGSAGASVLQLLAGGRAAALSGAYASISNDADAVFYNPAGIAALEAAGGIAYQRLVLDVGMATGTAAYNFRGFVIGLGAAFLDAGSINVIEPDPDFGGQTGRETGQTVSASEVAARLAVARRLLDDRLHVGAAVGFASTSIANASQSAPLVDIGAQWQMAPFAVGASLRNLGPAMSGGGIADADLPSEARGGVSTTVGAGGAFGGMITADVVHRIAESNTGLAVGAEGGLLPTAGQGIGAVLRVGYNGVNGEGALGTVLLGGGLSFGEFAIDYAYQNYEHFGALHRFGVRWTRSRD